VNKNDIINEIIRVEGGYVNDPSDSGGETNYGITIAVARKSGYTGSMRDMPRSVAFGIYERDFWNALQADHLNQLSTMVAEEVVDTAVNMGVQRSSTFLQRSLNVLNKGGTLYHDLKVDGNIGPVTSSALGILLGIRGVRGEVVLTKMLNCLQGSFYVVLSERREKDERFIFGWFENRVNM